MLSAYFDRYAAGYAPYKGGNWCYEDGCLYRGLAALHTATGETRWLAHLTRLVDAQIGEDGSLAGYRLSEYNIDHILSGRVLVYLHRQTAAPRYLRGVERLAEQLRTHPRSHAGVYWHKLRYPWQLWLDGIYMGLPFQIEAARLLDRPEMVTDALAQLSRALSLTLVPETGLYAHGYDEAGVQAWADPRTGRSATHWSRAIGWLAMALVDIAELVPADRTAPEALGALLTRLMDLRRRGGLWLQVTDRPGLPGNYEEMSASAMIVYAALKADRLGLLSLSETLIAELPATLEARALKGTGESLRMADICEVAGLGSFRDNYRDGSAEYYLSEPRVSDDPKGVGPLMMCIAEREMSGQRAAQVLV